MKNITQFGRRVAVPGDLELEVADTGNGPPVLLLHGGGVGDWFRPLFEEDRLAGAFRVLYPHRAGYGSSTQPSGHLSVNDHATHAAAVLDALHTGPAHVVGHSSGGTIALQLGLLRPDLVRSLSLLECAFTDVPAIAEAGQNVFGPALASFHGGDVRGAFEVFMSGMCGDGYRERLEFMLGPDAFDHAVRDSAYFFADEIGAVNEWQLDSGVAEQLDRPVLLVGGDRSGEVLPLFTQQMDRAAKLWPGARRVTVAGAHMFPLQSPAALANVLVEFLQGMD